MIKTGISPIRTAGLLLLSVFFIISGCDRFKVAPAPAAIPEGFDYGEVENGVYKNDFFKCRMSVPEGWYRMSSEEMADATKAGLESLSTDKDAAKKLADLSDITTAQLLSLFRHNPEELELGEENNSFILLAENVSSVPVEIDGKKYIEAMQSQSKKAFGNNISFEQITETEINGKKFAVCRSLLKLPVEVEGSPGAIQFINVRQAQYACIINKFAFVVTLSYLSEEGRKEVEDILQTLKFEE